MNDRLRDKRRRRLGIRLIVMGVGLVGRYFHPWNVMNGPDPTTLPLLFKLVTHGGAIIVVIGAAALLGRR